jgi:hypothetical protein
MSGDWQATPSSRVSSGSPEIHWVPWLIHKANTEHGRAAASDRSDRWGCGTTASEGFEVEDMHRNRKACVEAKQVCGRRHPRCCYDEVSQEALRGRVS